MLVTVRPDIASVATPAAARAEIIMAAVRQGAMAICAEKTLRRSLEETRVIAEACQRAGVALNIGPAGVWRHGAGASAAVGLRRTRGCRVLPDGVGAPAPLLPTAGGSPGADFRPRLALIGWSPGRGGGVHRGRRRPTSRFWWLAAGVVTAAAVGTAVSLGHRGARPRPEASRSFSALPSSSSSSSAPPPAAEPASVFVQTLAARLPVGLVGLSAAAVGGQVYLFGGSGPQGFSDQIYDFNPSADTLTAVGTLPRALHDGAAVPAGGGVLFCGGGRNTILNTVLRYRPGAAVAQAVGTLPQPLADLGAVSLGGRAYCLNGYTGTSYNSAVYAVGPGAAQTVAHLPLAVRYGAVAAVAGRIWSVGGLLSSGAASDAIQWATPSAGTSGGTGASGTAGTMPQPLDRAAGGVLGGEVIVVGGCDANLIPTFATIWGINPGSPSTPRVLGSLPQPLCWGAAASVGGVMYVFGGDVGTAQIAAQTIFAIRAG